MVRIEPVVWEYQIVHVTSGSLNTDQLNLLGASGWEIIRIDYAPPPEQYLYLLRRPRPDLGPPALTPVDIAALDALNAPPAPEEAP